MRNLTLVIKPEETVSDLIEEICDEESISPQTPFAFSAFCQNSLLQINIVDDLPLHTHQVNTYTPENIASILSPSNSKCKTQYMNPPLEAYLLVYKPLLSKMVERVYPRYCAYIPEKDDLLSILYLTLVRLHNKNYYLHQNLVYRSYLNALNLEIRTMKKMPQGDQLTSFDAPIAETDNGEEVSLYDLLADPISSEQAYDMCHYSVHDALEDMFERVKAAMLHNMSTLSFDRILIQLKTKSIDPSTAKLLAKYRERFSPGLALRSTKGKSKQSK